MEHFFYKKKDLQKLNKVSTSHKNTQRIYNWESIFGGEKSFYLEMAKQYKHMKQRQNQPYLKLLPNLNVWKINKYLKIPLKLRLKKMLETRL